MPMGNSISRDYLKPKVVFMAQCNMQNATMPYVLHGYLGNFCAEGSDLKGFPMPNADLGQDIRRFFSEQLLASDSKVLLNTLNFKACKQTELGLHPPISIGYITLHRHKVILRFKIRDDGFYGA